jgi:hypothetical protein
VGEATYSEKPLLLIKIPSKFLLVKEACAYIESVDFFLMKILHTNKKGGIIGEPTVPLKYIVYSIIKWHHYTHTHSMELPEFEMTILTNHNKP